MSIEQYWHEQPMLLWIYHKAYMQKIHQEAHLIGFYNLKALEVVFYPVLKSLGAKGGKQPTYLESPIITAENFFEKKVTRENVKQENRRAFKHQASWVNALSNNK